MPDGSDIGGLSVPPSIVQSRKPVPSLGAARRPSLLREVEVLARTHTAMCVDVLAEIARDKKNPAVARVAAADSLLDRGWGKSPLIVQVDSPVETMSDEMLAREIKRRLMEMVRDDSGMVVDHAPDDVSRPSSCDPVDA